MLSYTGCLFFLLLFPANGKTWTKDNKIASQSLGEKSVKNEYDSAGRLTKKSFGDTILAEVTRMMHGVT